MVGCGSSHDDQDETSCPLCTGDLPGHIVDRIMVSAASQGRSMSREDFQTWLSALEAAAAPSSLPTLGQAASAR